MMLALFTSAFLCSITLLVRADTTFIFPPSGRTTVTAGSKVQVSWTTDWGSVPVSLDAYQQDPGSTDGWKWSQLLGEYDPEGML